MSHSHSCNYPREKTVKFFAGRTGWYGEQCWSAHGRKFIKRLVNRTNRHFANMQTKKEFINYDNPHN